MVKPATAACLLLLVVFGPSSAGAEEEHYMVLFASRNRPWTKPRAHCFATFVRIADASAEEIEYQADTISWYPHGERCRLFRPPEKGHNADLVATLARCERSNQRIYKWGPYRIQPELYCMAIAQKCRLDACEVLWQAIDRRSRPKGIAINCVHAVSDIDLGRGKLCLGLASGDSACKQIAAHLQPWLINPEETHDWILKLLPLEGEELIDCSFEPCELDYAP